MTTLFYAKPELVIALNRSIIFVNPNDLQIFKSVELPEKLIDNPQKANEELDENGAEETNGKACVVPSKPDEPLKIQQVCYSPNRQFLAVTTSGQKNLLLYRCRPEHAWLVSRRPLARASSALTFSKDSESILVTDKTGDCYLYDCVNMDAPPCLLFGHLSIVYDILWSNDKKHIITCDRDDKIRITNYPETYDIHGYCLGHKEFVAGLRYLKENIILSISGDKTMRIWNFESCIELAKVELPGAAIKFDVCNIDRNKYEIAILHQLDECISIYEIEEQTANHWDFKEISTHIINDVTACSLCFADGRLYVAGIKNEKFTFYTLPILSALPPPEKWIDMVENEFKDYTWIPEDITTWFKKRYDNVSDYLERKKRRMEEKQK